MQSSIPKSPLDVVFSISLYTPCHTSEYICLLSAGYIWSVGHDVIQNHKFYIVATNYVYIKVSSSAANVGLFPDIANLVY